MGIAELTTGEEMSTKECCGTCKWFGRYPHAPAIGDCGRALMEELPHCYPNYRLIMDEDDGEGCPCYAEAEQ